MKFLLLLLSFSAMAEDRYYKETTSIVGYECPAGTYFRVDAKLCYPKQYEDETQRLPTHEGTRSTKRLNADAATVIVNNYVGGGKAVEMPPIDIVGVKRRKQLDKQALLDVLEGEWYQEEKSSDELVVE